MEKYTQEGHYFLQIVKCSDPNCCSEPWSSYFQDDIPLEIPSSSLQILKDIGGGEFGRVYLARAENIRGKPGLQYVAVKELKERPTKEEKEEFLCEIQTMKTVSGHLNIVALLGYCTRREPLQLVMEYVSCGDLLKYLEQVRAKHQERFSGNRNMNPCQMFSNGITRLSAKPHHPLLPRPFGIDLMNSSTASTSDSFYATDTEENNLRPSVTETSFTTVSQNQDQRSSTNSSLEYVLDHKELHNFATQIAKGMKYLHEKQITHRDLAARNILIDEHKTLKISDFGLSRSGIYVNTKNKKVPLRWLSIEAIRHNLYSDKSDVWAFGIVLWEIGTLGGHPYPTIMSCHELFTYLCDGKRLEQPQNCSKYLYELMLRCWASESDDRPGFSEILSKLEPVYQNIYVDFSKLSSDLVLPPTIQQIQNNNLKLVPKP